MFFFIYKYINKINKIKLNTNVVLCYFYFIKLFYFHAYKSVWYNLGIDMCIHRCNKCINMCNKTKQCFLTEKQTNIYMFLFTVE